MSRECGTGTRQYLAYVTWQLSFKHCLPEFQSAVQKLQPRRTSHFRGDITGRKKKILNCNACFAVITSFVAGNGRRAFVHARACLSYALSIHSGDLALVSQFHCSQHYMCEDNFFCDNIACFALTWNDCCVYYLKDTAKQADYHRVDGKFLNDRLSLAHNFSQQRVVQALVKWSTGLALLCSGLLLANSVGGSVVFFWPIYECCML